MLSDNLRHCGSASWQSHVRKCSQVQRAPAGERAARAADQVQDEARGFQSPKILDGQARHPCLSASRKRIALGCLTFLEEVGRLRVILKHVGQRPYIGNPAFRSPVGEVDEGPSQARGTHETQALTCTCLYGGGAREMSASGSLYFLIFAI